MNNIKQYFCLFHLIVLIQCNNDAEYCAKDGTCFENHNKYSKGTLLVNCILLFTMHSPYIIQIVFLEINDWDADITKIVELAVSKYNPCIQANCSCHKEVIYKDLQPFREGITKEMFDIAVAKGTKYQVSSKCILSLNLYNATLSIC